MERIPSIAEALDQYLVSWRVGGHSAESIRARGYLLSPVRKLSQASETPVYELDRELCQRLVLERMDAVKLSAVKNFMDGLASFLGFCERQGWVSRPHPLRGMERPKPEVPPHRYLTARQLRAVYGASRDDYERLSVLLMGGCGLRISEVCGLRWDRVNWESGTIEILGKGGHWRAIDARSALPLLKKIGPARGKVFPFGDFALRVRIQRMGRDAGLRWKMRPHELRHSFAVGFLEASEEDAFALQTILGHRSPDMTQHYVRSVRERAAIAKMRRVDLAGQLFGSGGEQSA